MTRTSRFIDVSSIGQAEEDFSQSSESRWIRKKIKMRECARFVAADLKDDYKIGKETLCFCGLPFYRHCRTTAIANSLPSAVTWSWKRDTKVLPTDAFGELEFVGYEDIQRKYIRIDTETNMRDVLHLLLNVWDMKKPNLLISVTGGTENFRMKSKLKDIFRRGMIKASTSTGAWIITGGINAGVMRYVGEAMRDYWLTAASTVPVVALGITTWGCVKNREDLQDTFGSGLWPATYTMTPTTDRNEKCLDPNHTHFLLVDNGTNNQPGVEIKFRAALERAIANIKTGNSQDDVFVPMILLLIEGGLDSLESVRESIRNGIPVVIVKWSGGLADILADIFESAKVECITIKSNGSNRTRSRSVTDNSIPNKLRKTIGETLGQDKIEEYYTILCECVVQRELVTVFDYHSTLGIDVAILKSLLKANKDQVFDQLKLALAWNRIDIAKSEIFTEDKIWPPGSLHEILFSAIKQDRVDFVDLLLDNGISFKDFVTQERLLKLYNTTPDHSLLRELLYRVKRKHHNNGNTAITLKDIKRLIKMLTDVNVEPYASRPANQQPLGSNRKKESKFPFEDLFLWSVLMNRQDMAKLFWRQGKDATAYALLAFGILNAIATKTDDTELRNSLIRNAEEFGDLAMGVLNECFEADEKKTNFLLIRRHEQFDGANCLKIAVKSDNKQFISHPACQDFFRNVWMGQLSPENGTWRLLISPLVLGIFLLKVKDIYYYVKDESTQSCNSELDVFMPAKHGTLERRFNIKRTISDGNAGSVSDCAKETLPRKSTELEGYSKKKLQGILWHLHRIQSIYTAPVMIFAHSVATYIVFLAIFSYMLLVEFDEDMGKYELIIFIWVITLMIEEMRQFCSTSQTKQNEEFTRVALWQKFLKKKKEYWSDSWNKVDVLTIVLFMLAAILRFCPWTITEARVAYSFCLMSFFFRILHIFTVHKELGPKIIMIRRMMTDLVFFMIILMVFVLSYSITSYAIMFPNSVMSSALVTQILRKGYWTLYGELFLDEYEGAEECTKNVTIYAVSPKNRCPEERMVATLLMAFYVLFANVLLLNILIAMFSNTFQKVQENTDRLWNYMRCSLIYEFYNKPFLPAPLSLPIYIFLMIKWVLNRGCGVCLDLTPDLSEAQDREIMQWENVIADAYSQKLKRNRENRMETKVFEISERLEKLTSTIGNMHSSYDTFHHIDRRLDSIEEKISKILGYVNWEKNKKVSICEESDNERPSGSNRHHSC
ncbi:transient receptor potential cation channel subfamily M member 2-like [Saccostrea echinata]|uniref:transient receptor potential cation channel subfamily M member 2-like n=1 Tax=Saccostrea echinata TaxID=191078 RepID=UPI002A802C97|nr:transient receptor potential cation channel subfamily M member 2-like [Saccostrea echinata]